MLSVVWVSEGVILMPVTADDNLTLRPESTLPLTSRINTETFILVGSGSVPSTPATPTWGKITTNDFKGDGLTFFARSICEVGLSRTIVDIAATNRRKKKEERARNFLSFTFAPFVPQGKPFGRSV